MSLSEDIVSLLWRNKCQNDTMLADFFSQSIIKLPKKSYLCKQEVTNLNKIIV